MIAKEQRNGSGRENTLQSGLRWRRRSMKRGAAQCGRYYCLLSLLMMTSSVRMAPWAAPAPQNGIASTTVADTVHMADGTPAQGSLVITWVRKHLGSGNR